MRKLAAVATVAAVALVMSTGVGSAAPEPKTFVAVMSAADEVPLCAQADNSARGVAVFHVVDEATGLVSYKVVANNLPGDIVAAHIHIAPPGVPGPILQPLALTPGAENGVIGAGTFTNKSLLDAMQANPQDYYVNVHSSVCLSGVIRGQLGDHGPPGTG
jgi:CHRD domain